MKNGIEKEYYQEQKKRVLEIYRYKCANCGRLTNSIHHIVFRSDLKGQSYLKIHDKANLIPLCNMCSGKLHHDAEQRDRPYTPKWR
jgi:5-methylcytosine-specific restriction endonuclease McrA